jgi:hypothetical protein
VSEAFVHGGMWRAAKGIREQLFKHALLETAEIGPGAIPLPISTAASSGHSHAVVNETAHPNERHASPSSLADTKATPLLVTVSAPATNPAQTAPAGPSIAAAPANSDVETGIKADHVAIDIGRATGASGSGTGSGKSIPHLPHSSRLSAAACADAPRNLQLIICGHSLGAGVAALLSLLLR